MIIAGTGHRPKYMPGKYDETNHWQIGLKKLIREHLIRDEPTLVISGGALGFDMFLAEAAGELGIPFDLYLPFRDQGKSWPQGSVNRLGVLKRKARRVVYTSWDFHGGVFDIRNNAMVDDCTLLYVCLNTELKRSGTKNCVDYAIKNNKNFKNFWI